MYLRVHKRSVFIELHALIGASEVVSTGVHMVPQGVELHVLLGLCCVMLLQICRVKHHPGGDARTLTPTHWFHGEGSCKYVQDCGVLLDREERVVDECEWRTR